MAFLKLTLRNPDERGDPEIYVNLDLAVSLRRSGDRTLIEFGAPTYRAVGSQTAAQERIEVKETPDEILERASFRKPRVLDDRSEDDED